MTSFSMEGLKMISITAATGFTTYIAERHVTMIYPPGMDGRAKVELVTGTTLFVDKDSIKRIVKQIEGSGM